MKIIFIILLISFSQQIFSQENVLYSDKDYLKLQDKARSYQYSNIDSSFYYLNKMEQSTNYVHKIFANGMKGYLYQLIDDSLNSRKHITVSYSYLTKIPDSNEKTRVKAYLLNFEGLCEWERFNIDLALEKYQEGKTLSEKVNDVPQIVRFNSNIALVIGEMGDVAAEITTLKTCLEFIKKNEYLFAGNEYVPIISNNYLNITNAYLRLSKNDEHIGKPLDSASYYCKKAINYSRGNTVSELATISIYGDIHVLKKEYSQAKKIYLSAHAIASEINLLPEYVNLSFKIGELYFKEKKQQEAQIFFKEVITNYENVVDRDECYHSFIMSNYYLSVIYDEEDNRDEAFNYSEVFLSNYSNLVNNNSSNLDYSFVLKEMQIINKKTNFNTLFEILIISSLITSVCLLVLLFIRSRRENEIKKNEFNALLSKNSKEIEKLQVLNQSVLEGQNKRKKRTSIINIDEAKEKDIVLKLTNLIEEKLYLNPDFNQRFVAKKIRTNTAYLSYVVNKHFNKSFSEYTNDLKINYVIDEMKSNPVLKKYTTQAIAESAGFKNAISFRKSFKNKTGYTPLEFLKNLED